MWSTNQKNQTSAFNLNSSVGTLEPSKDSQNIIDKLTKKSNADKKLS